MRYLGVDYGEKRIGLALSDESGKLAFPLEIITNTNLNPEGEVIQRLRDIIQEKGVEVIVLGESTNLKGEENTIMEAIREFKKVLEEQFDVEVIFEPEFFTSVQAARSPSATEHRDAQAAALILQSYLEKQQHQQDESND